MQQDNKNGNKDIGTDDLVYDSLGMKCRRFGFGSLTREEAAKLFLSLAAAAPRAGSVFGIMSSDDPLDFFDRTASELKRRGATESEAFLVEQFPQIANRICRARREETFAVSDKMTVRQRAKQQKDMIESMLKAHFAGIEEERALMMLFSRKGTIEYCDFVTQSSNGSVIIDIPAICSIACSKPAAFAILAHNHPSGRAYPSLQDFDTTIELYKALKDVGVELIEHYILTRSSIRSMREIYDFMHPDANKLESVKRSLGLIGE